MQRLQGQGVAYFQQVYARMKNAGCNAAVLGCTEIPLIMNDGNSPCQRSTRPGCSLGRRCGARWLRNRRLSQRSESWLAMQPFATSKVRVEGTPSLVVSERAANRSLSSNEAVSRSVTSWPQWSGPARCFSPM